MRKLIFLCLSAAALSAEPQVDPMISFQNSILCKVNENTISMLDVKKKLDILFYQNYADLVNSEQAKFQFYQTSWRPILSNIIDEELMLSDAKEKEIKISEGEIREELESRFGPNVMAQLDKLGLSHDDAWKMIEKDLIVRRMMWWFVHSKALQNVTPQKIKKAYWSYLEKHPACHTLKYRVLSLRGSQLEERVQKLATFLEKKQESPEFLIEALKFIDPEVQISNEFEMKDTELSKRYKEALDPLSPGEYSKPSLQKGIARIFYLGEKEWIPSLSFEEAAPNLQNELTQKEISKASASYLGRLRDKYGLDPKHLNELISDKVHPFSIQ